MYFQTWNKYLPVIKILLKKSVTVEQEFNLNVSDFKQAGATRKSGYKFVIQFSNGKVDNILTSDIAKDFAIALLEDANTKAVLLQNDYHISMNAKFQLNIRYVGKAATNESIEANEELMLAPVSES